jgi:hypothetical protein
MATISAKKEWVFHQLSREEYTAFVERAKAGEKHAKAFVGTIEPTAAKKIAEICGKTVSRVMVDSDAVWHAWKKKHHNLLDDDFLHFLDAVNAADSMEVSTKMHQDNQVLLFKKDINGIIVFLAEVREKNNWLAFMDCWRLKKQR